MNTAKFQLNVRRGMWRSSVCQEKCCCVSSKELKSKVLAAIRQPGDSSLQLREGIVGTVVTVCANEDGRQGKGGQEKEGRRGSWL